MTTEPMGFAIIGGGYVADYYMGTLEAHPELKCLGVWDNNPERLAAFAHHHGIKAYESYEAVLADEGLELVMNLTNPRSHFELTKAALEAGKHVYTEKPLGMNSDEARALVELAKEKELYLSTAPCSLLGETAQTLWKAVKDGVVGKVRLVYAAFDDGMVHQMQPQSWRGVSGAPWPMKDEFEIGCTYEHAAYVLSWLAAIFGPVRTMKSFASVRVPDKGIEVESMAPDFTVGLLEYDDEVVCRVTCSIVAPIDKSITIIGDKGILYTKYVRNDASPVYFKPNVPGKAGKIAGRVSALKGMIEKRLGLPFSVPGMNVEQKLPYARQPASTTAGGGNLLRSGGNKPVDFLRGPSEMVAAIREGRPSRLPPELGLHMTELVEGLQYPERFDPVRELTTEIPTIEPLPWR